MYVRLLAESQAVISIEAKDAKSLHEAMVRALTLGKDSDGDSIPTWSIDKDRYFHHGKPGKGSDNEWYERGWLIPKIASSTRVNLTFEGPATYNGKSNEAAFGVLHGRFVTWLINHFSGQFESLSYTDKRGPRRYANP